LFFPIFSTIISQFKQLKKKADFYWSKTVFFFSFGPIKSLFSLPQMLRKIRVRNWKKQDWLFGGLMSRTRYLFPTFSKNLTKPLHIVGIGFCAIRADVINTI
jgi:hypothetical protein